MAKKTSGLGRGLGDLLEDNMPQATRTHHVALKKDELVTVSPQSERVTQPVEKPVERPVAVQEPSTPMSKPLFDRPVRNRSIKANFINK
jgi:hypothetical protein